MITEHKYALGLILLILLSFGGCSHVRLKGGQTLDDPVGEYVAKKGYSSLDNVILVKYVSDFNNDGLEDIAVSDTREFKKDLNKWVLFTANDDLSFTVAGEILFNPDSIKIMPASTGKTKVYVYGEQSKGHGYIYEYIVSGQRIRKASKESISDSNLPYYLKNSPKRTYTCDLISFLKSRNCLWKKGYNAEVN